jgi:hypothetical protein
VHPINIFAQDHKFFCLILLLISVGGICTYIFLHTNQAMPFQISIRFILNRKSDKNLADWSYFFWALQVQGSDLVFSPAAYNSVSKHKSEKINPSD